MGWDVDGTSGMTAVTKSPMMFDELVGPAATKLYVRFAWIIFVNLSYYSAYFLLLFISPTALFGTIHEFHCTISVNFYLFLPYFQQKKFLVSTK